MLLWTDVETTGLDPDEGCLLEIALLVTNDDLSPIDEGISLLVRPTFGGPSGPYIDRMDPKVTEMHTKSGLLDAIRRGEANGSLLRPHEVEERCRTYVGHNSAEQLVLAGSSVHFDRAWIKKHLPKLAACFHYRQVDVSSFKETCRRWMPEVYATKPSGEPAHRSMLDITASIDELLWYKKNFIR